MMHDGSMNQNAFVKAALVSTNIDRSGNFTVVKFEDFVVFTAPLFNAQLDGYHGRKQPQSGQ